MQTQFVKLCVDSITTRTPSRSQEREIVLPLKSQQGMSYLVLSNYSTKQTRLYRLYELDRRSEVAGHGITQLILSVYLLAKYYYSVAEQETLYRVWQKNGP